MLVAITLCGCVSEPEFPELAAQPFPPEDTALEIVGSTIADVNGDALPDLILTSDGLAAERGAYVAVSARGHGFVGYHAFVPSPEVAPWAALAEDLNGDGLIDLALFGVDEPFDAAVGVHLGTRVGGAAFAPALIRPLPLGGGGGISPDYRLAVMTRLDVDGDEHPDLLIGTFRWEAILELERFDDGFRNAPYAELPRDSTNSNIVVTATAEADAETGHDDVLLARFSETVRYRNRDGIGFQDTGDSFFHDPNHASGHRRAGFFDLDGNGSTDVIGFFGVLSAILTGDVAEPYYELFDYQDDTDTKHVFVADLDDNGQPEVVIVNLLATTMELNVRLLPNLRLGQVGTPSELISDVEPDAKLVADFEVATAAAADFDGDGVVELYVFSRTGDRVCYELRASGISDCD